MKTIGVVIAIAAIFTQEALCFGNTDDHPLMKKTQKICKDKIPVDDEIYRRATELGDIQTDDRNLQCYVKCVFETAETMSKDGKVDLTDFINGMIPDAKAYYGPLMLACQEEIEKQTFEDLCVKSMKIYECLKRDVDKKYYYFV